MLTQKQVERLFSKFQYRSRSTGAITILGDWVEKNIVSINTHIGKVKCHKKIAPQLGVAQVAHGI